MRIPFKVPQRLLCFIPDDEFDSILETSVENGMLSDLYDVVNNTAGETLCKVVQILAELAKIGK